MKRQAMTIWLVLTMTLLVAGVVRPAAAQTSTWTAEYFNNNALAGVPLLTRAEQNPGGEWGYGSPAAGIPVDNFSARWSTTTYLNGGNYQVSVRADDGVRVSVDGVPYLDQWHLAAGQFYQVTIPLSAGSHTFTVDYFEGAETAYLLYNFDALGPVPAPGTPQARVAVQFLNVRALPTASSAILDVISLGQIYPVIGRSANSGWMQLNVNGAVGWVSTGFIIASNVASVPVTDGSGGGPYPTPIPPPSVGPTVTVTAYLLNVRNAPNPFTGAVITQIRRAEVYQVVGRNLDTSWVQINVNGQFGWVRATWVALSNIALVPVTSNTTNPSPPGTFSTHATVRAYFLNVRLQPLVGSPVLTVVSLGQTYPLIGRTGDSRWVQINVGGTLGWVRSTWVIIVPNLSNVPVTG